ncbi:protein SRG1-like [Macadamia integrifolia]|uniref:protein SRG1-like n=1 Tax=Macadamia integrifolia TaxID=60698 RepID=UPI001C527C06|nr:protein SRG1-like [Macadamia integrifolia]
MASKPVNFGSSLAVPNVQELMKVPINTIPPRYIRTDQDPPIISGAATLPAVPVIDLHKLLSVESSDLERARLHSACQEWGFFQLLNHGVSSSLVEKTKLEIQEFFKLPIEEKRKFWQQPGALEGFGQAFVVSEEQKLDWGDRFYIQSHPTYIRQPHLFPKLPIPFRLFPYGSVCGSNGKILEKYHIRQWERSDEYLQVAKDHILTYKGVANLGFTGH